MKRERVRQEVYSKDTEEALGQYVNMYRMCDEVQGKFYVLSPCGIIHEEEFDVECGDYETEGSYEKKEKKHK